MSKRKKNKIISWLTSTTLLSILFILGVFTYIAYEMEFFGIEPTIIYTAAIHTSVATTTEPISTTTEEVAPLALHLPTPEPLKALYMTNWVAGSKKLRSKLVDIVDTTELNTIVIDIKDYTGHIGYEVIDPVLKEVGSAERRITDLKEFIEELHKKNIYVIGRISAFQDSYYVKKFPQYAVKSKSGAVWKDYKKVSWLDAGAKPVWDYLVAIGLEAYSLGFDEINFDYIRFPSDGDMGDLVYPFSEGKVKSEVLNEFFAYISEIFHEKEIPISADLFGLTTSSKDDLGIGQILENALEHFDYVAPMVYPSHYPPGFNGWKNPSEKPYEIIHFSMSKAVERAVLATTTPSKLRPWLQDFSIRGVTYTPEMIRAQIQATYDVGLTSWMMWNASNVYTKSAYEEMATSSPI